MISLLMYAGRSYKRIDIGYDEEYRYDLLFDYNRFIHDSKESNITMILEKAPLEMYLTDGLNYIQSCGV